MVRSLSCLMLLTLIWNSIGIGAQFAFPTISVGDIIFFQKKEKRQLVYTDMPATFAKSENAAKYNSAIFVGDVMLARNVEFLMMSKDGEYPFAGLNLKDLAVNSAIIGNFEGTIPSVHIPTPIGQINFSIPTSSVSSLVEAGFTHISLGNNHSYDFQSEGLEHSRSILSEHLKPFGDPKSINLFSLETIDISGNKTMIFGINALETIDTDLIKQMLKTASRKSDYQIVYIHWGDEYALKQNSSQKKLAQELVEYGADLIIGHHPHVVQGVDLIDGVPVFYSLGNYIFDQYFSKDVQEGLVLVIDLNKGLQISLIPVTSKYRISQPNLMSKQKHSEFLQKLAQKSHQDLANSIIAGYIVIDGEIETLDKVAIMQGTQSYVQ